MNTVFDLIYLIACAVHEQTPDRTRVEAMDLEAVHSLSVSLELASLTCYALEAVYNDSLPNTPLFQTWIDEKNAAIYKSVLFDAERDEVQAFLEGIGCWFLPSKGCLLKDLYPEVGMREMVDNDILYDVAFQERIHEWFINRGYTAAYYKDGTHDCYLKAPFYNFEMHRALFGYMHDDRLREYYANVKDKLVLSDGSSFEYHMSDDDFYIYLVAHTFKHYGGSGAGLRSLLDFYVFRNAQGTELNWDYISGEIALLGEQDFELQARTVSQKLFEKPGDVSFDSLSDEEVQFLQSFVAFGSHGTIENSVRNRFKNLEPNMQQHSTRGKFRYVWKRVFPGSDIFRTSYTFFYRHRWLLPIGYIYRLVAKGVKHHDRFAAELRALRKL